jgi:hypothetical protein
VYFTLAPRIVPSATRDPGTGNVVVHVAVSPDVRAVQRVSMFFDDQEIRAPQLAAPSVATIDFPVGAPPVGSTHRVRLRVDGVDSFLVLDYSAAVPAFDPTQQVTV